MHVIFVLSYTEYNKTWAHKDAGISISEMTYLY